MNKKNSNLKNIFSTKTQYIYTLKSFPAYIASAVAALRSLRWSSSGSWQLCGSNLEKHINFSLIWSIIFSNLSEDFLTNLRKQH